MKSVSFKFFWLLFLLNPTLNGSPAQSNKFIGGVFFNANGIHIVGDDRSFWQSSSGSRWGGGGISGGVNVKRYIDKNIYYTIELRYIQKGGIYLYINDYGTESLDLLRLNYIEIPVLLGFTFKRNKKDYMLETGPGFAQLFSSKLKINEFVNRNVYPEAQKFKKQDLSWIGCFKFPLNQKGKRNILFGLRFSYSLFSIHQNHKLKNMVYGIQLDYIFNS
jgi:hypothetical protein